VKILWKKSAAWVRAEISGAKWLSRGELRRFLFFPLFFFPKKQASADEPDCLTDYDHAEDTSIKH
jgi:hypothetical protein